MKSQQHESTPARSRRLSAFMLRVGTAVLALAIAAPALAQTAPKVSPEVQKHFSLGNDYYQEGKYASALAEYDEAYNLSADEQGRKNWKILFNRGQCLVMLGREPEAIASFEQYLAEGGDQIDAARRAQVEADIKKLRDRLGTMTLEGTAPTGAIVKLDGRLMGKMPLPGPMVAASGVHDLVITPPGGGPPYVSSVTFVAGKNVVHRVVMTVSGPATESGPVPYVDTAPPPPLPPPKLPPRVVGGLVAPSWMLGLQLGMSLPTADYRGGERRALGAAELSIAWRASGFIELGLFAGGASGRYGLDESVRTKTDNSLSTVNVDSNADYSFGIIGGRARMHLVRSGKLDGWLGVDLGGFRESWTFSGTDPFKYRASSFAFGIGFGADYALSEKWALGVSARFLQASASSGERYDCSARVDCSSQSFLPGEGVGADPKSTTRGFFDLGLRLVYVIPIGEKPRATTPPPATTPAAPPPATPAAPPATASIRDNPRRPSLLTSGPIW